jgi:hypothetical protein
MSDLGRYRKLYPRLWRHPSFVSLTDGDKTVALYVLNGPQSNRLGLYMLSIAAAAEDLRSTPETLKKRLLNVCETFGWLFDADARVIYIPSWWRWNPPENENVLKGNLKDLNDIPSCGLVDAFARNTGYLAETFHQTFLEGLRKHIPQPSRNQKQYQGSESERQEQEPSALRAGADNGESPPPVSNKHLEIARRVLKDSPNAGTEYLVDAFHSHCQASKIETTRAFAIAALTAAR